MNYIKLKVDYIELELILQVNCYSFSNNDNSGEYPKVDPATMNTNAEKTSKAISPLIE